MLRTLYRKLSLVLLLLLLALGALDLYNAVETSRAYSEEVQQRLQRDLAAHLVAEKLLLLDGEVRREALEEIFHTLMVVNPSIEVYLLDRTGAILAYSAPPGKVRRRRVSLAPIEAFLSGAEALPIRGDDPRGERRRKIFSVAPIGTGNGMYGYLYVILAGEEYQSVFERVAASQILRASSVNVAFSLGAAGLVGLLLFHLATRRLTLLTRQMRIFEEGGFARRPAPAGGARRGRRGDEISELAETFHRLAQRIVAQIEDLRRLDRSRRELVANVSHDLRTPLAHIQGYLETLLLRRQSLPPAEQREYLEIALAQAERLGGLVAQLFELARLEASAVELALESFSPAELLQDVAQKFHLAARQAGVEINLFPPRDLPFVEADLALVERALTNLLENALRYTPEGGRIRLSAVREGDGVRVRVADTGRGIPPDELPHIFERFYRSAAAAEELQGAGLGLAIARGIVELHGGSLDCASEPGRGTVMSFVLPAARQPAGTAGIGSSAVTKM